MADPSDRPRKPRVHLRETVNDPVTTDKLAKRVRRDVALESAEKATEGDRASEVGAEKRVAVVLGPDGVPRIAEHDDAADAEPETVRVDPRNPAGGSGKNRRR